MFEKFFKEIFTENFEEYYNKMNEIFNILEEEKTKENNVDENKNNNVKTYFHSISDEYENGRQVSHKEKEVKNGEVIKDIDNCIECKKENCNESLECTSTVNKEDLFNQKLTELEETVDKLGDYIKDLEIENDNLRIRNKELEEKINLVKSVF